MWHSPLVTMDMTNENVQNVLQLLLLDTRLFTYNGDCFNLSLSRMFCVSIGVQKRLIAGTGVPLMNLHVASVGQQAVWVCMYIHCGKLIKPVECNQTYLVPSFSSRIDWE